MPRSRFSLNLAANLLNFGLSMLVGYWLTPYLIRHLGVAAYGLIPLTTTVTSYLALFTTALNSVVGRFLTMALDQQDDAEANRIFNTSFWGGAGMILLILGPCLWTACHASWFFHVPPGLERDFTLLALSALAMFCLTELSTAINVISFCRNRFDLANAVNVASTLTRVAVIVLLFNLTVPRVWHVGFALLAAASVSVAGAILIWRRLAPVLKLRPAWFSFAALRNMTGMGGWIVINAIGSMLYLSIDLVVVNRLLGPEATGRYGAVLIWSSLLRGFAGVVGGVFGPTIFMLFSRDDLDGLVHYARRAVKFVGLVLAIPIGLICGLSKPLLRIWLGEAYVPLAPLLSIMTFHLCVNLAVLPLFNIQVATSRVRLPGIITCVMGVGNLGLAILLAGPAGWGMYGVAAAGALMLTAKNIVFTPIYAARILGLERATFYRELLPVAGATLGLAFLGWAWTTTLEIRSLPGLALAGLVLTLAVCCFILAFLFDQDERGQIRRMLFRWSEREP